MGDKLFFPIEIHLQLIGIYGDDGMGREASLKTGAEISKIVRRTSMMMMMMIVIMAPVSTSH
jgi:hypothetical protein